MEAICPRAAAGGVLMPGRARVPDHLDHAAVWPGHAAPLVQVAGGDPDGLDGEFVGRRPSGRIQEGHGGRQNCAVSSDRHDRGDRLAALDGAADRRNDQRAVRCPPGHAGLRRLAELAVARWTRQVEADRAAALARDATQARHQPGRRLTAGNIRALITSLGDLHDVIRAADPAEKTAIYDQLGLKITFKPGQAKFRAGVTIGPEKYVEHAEQCGDTGRVRGGT